MRSGFCDQFDIGIAQGGEGGGHCGEVGPVILWPKGFLRSGEGKVSDWFLISTPSQLRGRTPQKQLPARRAGLPLSARSAALDSQ
ncbi:MAG: hypothetical protein ACPGVG_06640 [Mycobacterium sp.]